MEMKASPARSLAEEAVMRDGLGFSISRSRNAILILNVEFSKTLELQFILKLCVSLLAKK